MDIITRHIQPLRPKRHFKGLMDIYESNYTLMGRLLGPVGHEPAAGISQVGDDSDLHIRLLSRERYTTTWHLTYWFDNGRLKSPEPDLTVRVYHDAAVAEVLHCGKHEQCEFLKHFTIAEGKTVEQRWQRNLLLNKWLQYLLSKGHSY